jgi:hypothetical protein
MSSGFSVYNLSMSFQSGPEIKSCWRCGLSFECRARTGNCWCESLPSMGHKFPQDDCLCPACLKNETEKSAARDTPKAPKDRPHA